VAGVVGMMLIAPSVVSGSDNNAGRQASTHAPAAFGGLCTDSIRVRYLLNVQQMLYNDRFDQADSVANRMIAEYHDDPAGYLLKAIGRLTEMFDSEENLYPEQFQGLIDTTLRKALKVRDTTAGATCAWMSLFAGNAVAYHCLWESRFGSLLNAIVMGRRAKREYEFGLECDSTIYDLYFGLGLYHYWKSAKAGLLRSLGFIRDDRDKGLAQLSLAAESSVVSRDAARNAMMWTSMDRKEYDSVIVMGHEMLDKYPDGKAALWPLARAYFEKKDYPAAVEVYGRLRSKLGDNPGNYFNLIECDYNLHRCYEELSKPVEAKKAAIKLLDYYARIPKETQRRQRSKIAFLRRAAADTE